MFTNLVLTLKPPSSRVQTGIKFDAAQDAAEALPCGVRRTLKELNGTLRPHRKRVQTHPSAKRKVAGGWKGGITAERRREPRVSASLPLP